MNLLHIIALLLVLCMGVDYGVFMVEDARVGGSFGRSFLAIATACATTTLSFGLLAMSEYPRDGVDGVCPSRWSAARVPALAGICHHVEADVTRSGLRAAVGTTLLMLCSGCGSAPPRDMRDSVPPYPGELVDTSAMGVDFMARQRVTFIRGGRRETMSAVIQKKADEFLLVALTPVGSRAFVLTQRGTSFEVRSFVPSLGARAPEVCASGRSSRAVHGAQGAAQRWKVRPLAAGR